MPPEGLVKGSPVLVRRSSGAWVAGTVVEALYAGGQVHAVVVGWGDPDWRGRRPGKVVPLDSAGQSALLRTP